MNKKIQIKTDYGEIVEAQSPIIISASRSTDIPAFYAEWFINRLKAGYIVWYNPFNKQPIYISFKNCKVVVFWTKNPKPLIPLLSELDKRGIHYYFQFTLNDYSQEGFEPNVKSVEERVIIFKQLSRQIGREKVIWRFDPIILTTNISPREILKKVWCIGNKLKGHTNKLVFSFVDINTYRKVQYNLVKETSQFSKEIITQSEFSIEQMYEIAEGLVKINEHWKQEGWDLTLATCAENIDLDKYGIKHNRCIDGDLMKQIFAEDSELVYYLNYGKFPDKYLLFADEIPKTELSAEKFKDKGQRKICGCMISKDIGMYNTCKHFCAYCYANSSKKAVIRNLSLHTDNSESIIR